MTKYGTIGRQCFSPLLAIALVFLAPCCERRHSGTALPGGSGTSGGNDGYSADDLDRIRRGTPREVTKHLDELYSRLVQDAPSPEYAAAAATYGHAAIPYAFDLVRTNRSYPIKSGLEILQTVQDKRIIPLLLQATQEQPQHASSMWWGIYALDPDRAYEAALATVSSGMATSEFCGILHRSSDPRVVDYALHYLRTRNDMGVLGTDRTSVVIFMNKQRDPRAIDALAQELMVPLRNSPMGRNHQQCVLRGLLQFDKELRGRQSVKAAITAFLEDTKKDESLHGDRVVSSAASYRDRLVALRCTVLGPLSLRVFARDFIGKDRGRSRALAADQAYAAFLAFSKSKD